MTASSTWHHGPDGSGGYVHSCRMFLKGFKSQNHHHQASDALEYTRVPSGGRVAALLSSTRKAFL